MILLVGLGNPGARYAGNRHNLGFMVLDAIAARYPFGPFRRRFHSLAAEGTISGTKVLLLKPQTYMNESGLAVGEALRYLKIEPPQVSVFYDEVDLLPGKVRVKLGGGAAGHNGVRSIAQHIGPHFCRVRLGIGHPGDKDAVATYVLSDFAKSERALVAAMIDAVAEAVPLLIAEDDSRFMNKVSVLLRAKLGPDATARDS